uniref:Transposase n=1 Tax=Burkholderia sp. B8(2020) TaxID=2713619 RepID=A0A6G6CWV6_9BURK|nr:hypothetical protein [Burkholderia sp. B8(2020)]
MGACSRRRYPPNQNSRGRRSRGLCRKPLKCDDDDLPLPSKQINVSCTDPHSGYRVRDDKPKGFFYLDHRTVEAKHAIITDTHVTPASVHDSQPSQRVINTSR